jgi:hypothetical protein
MDRVVAVQHLSVLDLLDPNQVHQRASIVPPSSDEFTGNHLILRPHIQTHSIQVIALEGKKAAHYLIGRVCQLGMETQPATSSPGDWPPPQFNSSAEQPLHDLRRHAQFAEFLVRKALQVGSQIFDAHPPAFLQ